MFTIYEALEAFLHEHRRCGALDTGDENWRVWICCASVDTSKPGHTWTGQSRP